MFLFFEKIIFTIFHGLIDNSFISKLRSDWNGVKIIITRIILNKIYKYEYTWLYVGKGKYM